MKMCYVWGSERITMHYTPGDRIRDAVLGDGTVYRTTEDTSMAMRTYKVLFDNDPPVEVNDGTNPCLWWPGCYGE